MIEFSREEILQMTVLLREVILDLKHYYNVDSVAAHKVEEVQDILSSRLNEDE